MLLLCSGSKEGFLEGALREHVCNSERPHAVRFEMASVAKEMQSEKFTLSFASSEIWSSAWKPLGSSTKAP